MKKKKKKKKKKISVRMEKKRKVKFWWGDHCYLLGVHDFGRGVKQGHFDPRGCRGCAEHPLARTGLRVHCGRRVDLIDNHEMGVFSSRFSNHSRGQGVECTRKGNRWKNVCIMRTELLIQYHHIKSNNNNKCTFSIGSSAYVAKRCSISTREKKKFAFGIC